MKVKKKELHIRRRKGRKARRRTNEFVFFSFLLLHLFSFTQNAVAVRNGNKIQQQH